MYGWEFPPKNQGGLGVACEGIVNGLLDNGLKVHLVLPSSQYSSSNGNLQITDASKVTTETVEGKLKSSKINSGLLAYQSTETYQQYIKRITSKESKSQEKNLYGRDLFEEVDRYAHVAGSIGAVEDHDVIHAHDWMTYPAAIMAKHHSGKPMVAHIHATEFDRTGGNPNQHVYDIEKLGFEHADKIIAVSELTKNKIIEHYGIPGHKIEVVHNALSKRVSDFFRDAYKQFEKTVLFLGRMTMQKGPDYFLKAAKKVLEYEDDVKFVMAGDGDMMGQVINQAHELGIERHIIFTGFLRGAEIDKAYQTADIFIMPSISEPFGLTALEAIKNGTPVLISKQSGAAEVLKNVLKVDFWDTDEMANKIITLLRHDPLAETLKDHSKNDLDRLDWKKQTEQIKSIYHTLA